MSTRIVSEHLMLMSGECARGMRAWGASSEAEIRPKGWTALERGGDSPEGAASPRATWRFAQGGSQPSSEAEIRPRGQTALERGCPLGGPWAFFLHRTMTMWGVFTIYKFICVLLFCKKGGFSWSLGDPYGHPQQ
jgi:hypothetical protein